MIAAANCCFASCWRASCCRRATSALAAAPRAKDWRQVAAALCALASRRTCPVRLALSILRPACILTAARSSSAALARSAALGSGRLEMSMAWKPGVGFSFFLKRNDIPRAGAAPEANGLLGLGLWCSGSVRVRLRLRVRARVRARARARARSGSSCGGLSVRVGVVGRLGLGLRLRLGLGFGFSGSA